MGCGLGRIQERLPLGQGAVFSFQDDRAYFCRWSWIETAVPGLRLLSLCLTGRTEGVGKVGRNHAWELVAAHLDKYNVLFMVPYIVTWQTRLEIPRKRFCLLYYWQRATNRSPRQRLSDTICFLWSFLLGNLFLNRTLPACMPARLDATNGCS